MGSYEAHRIRFYEPKPVTVNCLAYCQVLEKLAIGRADGSIEILTKISNWTSDLRISGRKEFSVECLSWINGRLFSGSLSGHLSEFNVESGRLKFSRPCDAGAVWQISVGAEESLLACGTEQGVILLFELGEDEIVFVKRFDRQIEGRVLCLSWMSQEVIVSGGINTVRVWDVALGKCVTRILLPRVDEETDTIVWCLGVCGDSNIVTGDSRGYTCFWDSVHGVLLKCFKVHKADVLSVCVSNDGKQVFSAGSDPVIACFRQVQAEGESSYKWTQAETRSKHTHDVRALLSLPGFLLSAGEDASVMLWSLKNDTLSVSPVRQLIELPEPDSVHVLPSVCKGGEISAAVVLQYETHLELWRLGCSTHMPSSVDDDASIGKPLPFSRGPCKLLQIKCKSSAILRSSACVSKSASSKGKAVYWIAYATLDVLRIFQVSRRLSLEDSVELTPVRSLPLVFRSYFAFFLLGNNTTGRLGDVMLTADCGKLAVGRLEDSKLQESGVVSVNGLAVPTCMAVSLCTLHAAVGDLQNVFVINVDSSEVLFTLPVCSHPVTALAFGPSRSLYAVYADRSLVEINLKEESYTSWSKTLASHMPNDWKRKGPLLRDLQVVGPQGKERLILYDRNLLCVIRKDQAFPSESSRSVPHSGHSFLCEKELDVHCFHVTREFKYIVKAAVFLGPKSVDHLVVAEITPFTFLCSLPPSISKKKFGT